MRRFAIFLSTALPLLGASLFLRAQDSDSDVHTRQLWNKDYLAQRPPAPSKKRPAAPPPAAPTADNAFIGVTLWRLRLSQPSDAPAVRMLVHEVDTSTDQDWTPERCEASTGLKEGQKVRLSLESARAGFLYIVDREQYGDGSFGDALLIFPTRLTLHGNNQVRAGQVIDIPGNGEGFFRVQRSRPDQVAEEITILVSPKPLGDLHISTKPLPIPKEQLALWKKIWGAAVKQLEEPDKAGKPATPAEKEAGENGAILTDADPLPQTLFRIKSGPGSPLLVTLPLKIQ